MEILLSAYVICPVESELAYRRAVDVLSQLLLCSSYLEDIRLSSCDIKRFGNRLHMPRIPLDIDW